MERSCSVRFMILAHPDIGDFEQFEVFPWSARGSSGTHNGARRSACKNGRKCLQAAWKAADNVGGTPTPCEKTGYRRPQPEAGTLRGAITREVLDALNIDPKSTANGVTIEVFGRISGDNGCGGEGLETSTNFRLGKYYVKANNPDKFKSLD